MIEVFKTDIPDERVAMQLLRRIHLQFSGYEASFDLEDCDRILRIVSRSGAVDCFSVAALFRENGYQAAPLADNFS